MNLRASLFVLLLLFASQGNAQPTDTPIRPYRSAGIIDATTLQNGQRLFLFRHGVSDKDEAPEYQRGGIYKTFTQFFRHPTDPNVRLAIAWLDADKKNGMGLYSFKHGEKGVESRFEAHISERIRQPAYYQSRRGDIFIGSRNGVIYWIKPDFTTLRYQLKLPQGEEPNPRKIFRKIEFASFPGSDLVCAYSIADPKYHSRALFDVLVADPKSGWRSIDLGRRATGPATMTAANELKMLLFDRWLNIDIESGGVTETEFDVPREAEAKVKPVSVVRVSDGTLISIWRKTYRSYKPGDIDPFENGLYQRVCQWEGGQWKVVQGKNRSISKKITEVADSSGGWWTATAEGTLLYRGPAGQFRELDYRSGVATDSIGRLVADGDDKLWILGRVPIELSMAGVLKTEPVDSTEWREVFSKTSVGLSRYAPYRFISPFLTPEDKIICISNLDRRYDFPSPDILPMTNGKLILFEDQQGRPWVVSTGDEQQWYVAGFVDEIWKAFEVIKPQDISWYQAVGQWFSEQNLVRPIDYLGTRTSFGPENRIAYVYRGKVSLFDGNKWFSDMQIPAIENQRTRPQTAQFTNHKVRIWYSRYFANDLAFHFWKDLGGASQKQWQEVPAPTGLPLDYRKRREEVRRLTNSVPEKDDNAWLYSDEFRFAWFSPAKVSLFDSQHWTTLPTAVSPFSATRSIAAIGQHHDGAWVFQLSSRDTYRYIIYRPELAKLVVTNSDLGSLENASATVQPKWTSDPPLQNALLRFQVDSAAWSPWQPANQPVLPGAVMPAGKHDLRIQLHCPDQMLPRLPLEYTFNADYEMSTDLQALIEKLSAMDFQDRQDAESELIRVGKQAYELLSERYESEKDPETRAAIGRILKALNTTGRNDDTQKHDQRPRGAAKKR